MADFVNVEAEDGVAVIRLDRPPMNALSMQVQEELRAAAETVDRDEQVRAVVVYGGEKVFAAGADVKEMSGMGYTDMSTRAPQLSSAFDAVAQIGKPVVAAVTGFALGGGCELALACDIRICADDAKFGQPEIKLGLIPGAGGTQRLPRLIGPAKAKELIFTGRMVEAQEALRIGLVDDVVPAADVLDAARKFAEVFSGGPSRALRAAKQAVDTGLELDMPAGLAWESQLFAGLFATQDSKEGMQAFSQKRSPGFAGE